MSKELGLALRAARVAKGLTVKAIADACDVKGPAVSQWEAGRTEPTFANLRRVADMVDVPVDDLLRLATGRALEGTSAARPAIVDVAARIVQKIQQNIGAAPDAPPFDAVRGYALDIPVWGTAVGGDDSDFRLNGQEIDRALRPHGLLKTKDVFALRVTNDSMYPAWRDGALIYINPHRKPMIGDDVVIEMWPTEDGEPGNAYLKRLKARTPTRYIVEQFNPPCDIEFDLDQIKRVYRVVPVEELLGIS